MKDFGRRMQKLRESVGLNCKQMAMLLDVTEVAIERYEENYNEPTEKVIRRLAQIFEVSEAYAAMLTDEPAVCEDLSVKEVLVTRRIPGGSGMMMLTDIVGSEYVDKNEVRGKDCYGFVMPDDSMIKARIQKNDVLIVCRQNHASDGEVVVAVIGDSEGIVRRFYKNGNVVTLVPESPSPKYKEMKVDTTETAFKISGKVIEVRIRNI